MCPFLCVNFYGNYAKTRLTGLTSGECPTFQVVFWTRQRPIKIILLYLKYYTCKLIGHSPFLWFRKYTTFNKKASHFEILLCFRGVPLFGWKKGHIFLFALQILLSHFSPLQAVEAVTAWWGDRKPHPWLHPGLSLSALACSRGKAVLWNAALPIFQNCKFFTTRCVWMLTI